MAAIPEPDPELQNKHLAPGGGPSHQGIVPAKAAVAESETTTAKATSTVNLAASIMALANAPHPGKATPQKYYRPVMKKEEIAVVVAVGVLLRPEREPWAEGVRLADLIGFSALDGLYKRKLQAVGHAAGENGLGLERVSAGIFRLDHDNRVRAFHFLRDPKSGCDVRATTMVAYAIPGLSEGDSVMEYVLRRAAELKAAESD